MNKIPIKSIRLFPLLAAMTLALATNNTPFYS